MTQLCACRSNGLSPNNSVHSALNSQYCRSTNVQYSFRPSALPIHTVSMSSAACIACSLYGKAGGGHSTHSRLFALDLLCRQVLHTDLELQWLTNLAKGSFLISSSVLLWYLRISRNATVPGRYLKVFLPASFFAVLLSSCEKCRTV